MEERKGKRHRRGAVAASGGGEWEEKARSASGRCTSPALIRPRARPDLLPPCEPPAPVPLATSPRDPYPPWSSPRPRLPRGRRRARPGGGADHPPAFLPGSATACSDEHLCQGPCSFVARMIRSSAASHVSRRTRIQNSHSTYLSRRGARGYRRRRPPAHLHPRRRLRVVHAHLRIPDILERSPGGSYLTLGPATYSMSSGSCAWGTPIVFVSIPLKFHLCASRPGHPSMYSPSGNL